MPRFIKELSLRTKVIIGVSFFVVLSYGLIFVLPKQVTYAYGGDVCVKQLTLLPALSKQPIESNFAVVFKNSVRIGDMPLFALKSCFESVGPPVAGKTTVKVSPFGGWIGVKHYQIAIPEPATARSSDFIDKTLPVTHPIKIQLSQPDEVFSYRIAIGDKKATCDHKNSQLLCDITKLDLAQGATYPVQLDRHYKETKVATLAKGELKTLQALILGKGSVAEGQVVYDKPAAFTFEYDKELDKAAAELKVRNGDALEVVAAKTTVKDKVVIVTPDAAVKRNAAFELTIKSAQGKDGSSLADKYKVAFNTSGGPKVTGISVGSVGAPVAGTITLSFDQEIANVDAIAKLVTVQGVSAQIAKSGASLKITYSGDKCASYTITVAKGLKSAADIEQTDAWSFNGRTRCYTLQTIGTSKNGRAINAYIFGSGGKTVLYTGTIHGNEYSARNLMNAWVDEIEAHPQNIPAGTQLIVIPVINPDGAAAGTRTNANNVDLNRNFNVSDWKSDIQTVGGQPFPGGGGSAPESEPETKALVAFTRRVSPSLTMSYHAAAAYVIGNTCGNTSALAGTYASMVGYRNMTGVGGAFAYEITGTYDDWMCEKLGLRSVLVELTTNSYSEFSRHRSALWLMSKS